MKRRQFVRNISLATLSIPFISDGFGMKAVNQKLFNFSTGAEDRVLILIQLNGGNDGLNTVIPIDQYANLMVQRSDIIIPQNQVLTLTQDVGLHPVMTGMKNMFNAGNLSILQNVGYPEQNRSHFRSADIWSTGSLDVNQTNGWLGRHFDALYPNFPEQYPNPTNLDPFAISMGSEVSATCQGLMGNFSHTVSNPFNSFNLYEGGFINDGSYFGNNVEYVATLINQSNEYGARINQAATAGNTLSTLYDPLNSLAVQLKYIAQMISGGLQTKVYILNLSGFDTHDGQVDDLNHATGTHSLLLKKLSDAIAAFQDDLQLLGIQERVAGLTFSEFGRQIAANASFGTDHGDAAPCFLFGSCINAGIIGPNPQISNLPNAQAGVPMNIDFRNIYASLLKDWFGVPAQEVQALFEHQINYYNIIAGCNVGLDDIDSGKATALLYPNPTPSNFTIKFNNLVEGIVSAEILDLNGRTIKRIFSTHLNAGIHHIPCESSDLAEGHYIVSIRKGDQTENLSLIKIS